MLITITWRGGTPDELTRRFMAVKERLINELVAAFSRAAYALQQHIQNDKLRGQSVNVVTGELLDSVKAIPAEREGDTIIQSRVVATSPHAVFVNDGTAAHEILPSNAKALHFLAGGSEVFARSVQNPGIQARHFMEEAYEEMRPEIVNHIAISLQEVLESA